MPLGKGQIFNVKPLGTLRQPRPRETVQDLRLISPAGVNVSGGVGRWFQSPAATSSISGAKGG